MQEKMKDELELVIEVLEERIAPGKTKGNNGFGNGAGDGVPGNSGFEDTDR